MLGTIEWFFVYHIRGKNGGIHGIVKRRNLIGDGQHAIGKIGLLPIKNTIKSEIIMINSCSLDYE